MQQTACALPLSKAHLAIHVCCSIEILLHGLDNVRDNVRDNALCSYLLSSSLIHGRRIVHLGGGNTFTVARE